MFDVDEFVSECIHAVAENEPRLAVRDVLERAMQDAERVAEALPATRGELVPLHVSDELTVLKVIWAPGMRFRPHNHLMWAAIGLYGGQEDNTFYRRSGEGIVASGGRELRTGDVALLGDNTIHAVENPRQAFTGAIHVYGGNITARPGRSEWDDDSGQEVDYDFEHVRRYFESFQAPASRLTSATPIARPASNGSVVRAPASTYDDVRQVWNGHIQRRPALERRSRQAAVRPQTPLATSRVDRRRSR